MSVGPILTRGFGQFSDVTRIARDGYLTAAPLVPTDAGPVWTAPPGPVHWVAPGEPVHWIAPDVPGD